ncbi:hypothetical protein GDO78_003866 [Eleutherodactylus coqui]|uniref:Deacetylase sirtuin-type domain-containing protein n=1 Tax=Eleutherodactylus coqui TaxID=57060 RepID=A0A8J6ETK8_ELECQ|nr:hypothetical protein GDO78_003866 [Eleutherodactylus coqui]
MALLCGSYQSCFKKIGLLAASPQLVRAQMIHAGRRQLLSHSARGGISLLTGCNTWLTQRPSCVRGHSSTSRAPSLTDVAEKVKEGFYRRILVMVGAGISTDSGIPDFRFCFSAAGIPAEKLVEAHGSFASSTCTMCLKEYPEETFRDAVMKSEVPRCSACGGLIKPDIVFFGEQLPARFFLHLTDFPRADLLFVMGTSLEVEPFASLVYAVSSSTPRILINRDPVGPFLDSSDGLSVMELGEVSSGVKHLVHLLGWERDMEELENKNKNFDDTSEDLHQ